MSAKKKRSPKSQFPIGSTSAPAETFMNAVEAAFKRVTDLFKKRAKLDARRAEVAAMETHVAELRASLSSTEKELRDEEKQIRQEIPEAASIIDVRVAKSEIAAEKPVVRRRGRKAGGGKLTSEQVDQVLAGLAEPFGANDFSKAAEELFPGVVNVPIKTLAAGKITQVKGTKSRGTKYTKA